MECPKGADGTTGQWVAWAFLDLGRELPGTTAASSDRCGCTDLPSGGRIITAAWRRNQFRGTFCATHDPGRRARSFMTTPTASAPSRELAIRPAETSRELALCA
jgi:hypothetical protein